MQVRPKLIANSKVDAIAAIKKNPSWHANNIVICDDIKADYYRWVAACTVFLKSNNQLRIKHLRYRLYHYLAVKEVVNLSLLSRATREVAEVSLRIRNTVFDSCTDNSNELNISLLDQFKGALNRVSNMSS